MLTYQSLQRPVARLLYGALIGGLITSLIGCAGTPPPPWPTFAERSRMEDRVYIATYPEVFEAAVLSLRDLGFTPDLISAKSGLITAAKESPTEFAMIYNDEDNPRHGKSGTPTWVWIAAGAVLVVVAAVAAIMTLGGGDDEDDSDDDKADEEKKEEKKKFKNKDSGTEITIDTDDRKTSKPEVDEDRRRGNTIVLTREDKVRFTEWRRSDEIEVTTGDDDRGEENDTSSAPTEPRYAEQLPGAGVRDPGGNTRGGNPSTAGARVDSVQLGTTLDTAQVSPQIGVRDPGGNTREGVVMVGYRPEADTAGRLHQKFRQESPVTTNDLPPKQDGKTRIDVGDTLDETSPEVVYIEERIPWYYDLFSPQLNIIVAEEEHEGEWFHYRLTFTLDVNSDQTIAARLSVQGSRMKGDKIKMTGPVFDARLSGDFYALLEQHLHEMKESPVP